VSPRDLIAWLPAPPETTNGVWAWFLGVFVLYMFARKGVARIRGHRAPTNMARLSDAATFAGSLLLLVGIVNPVTLKAVGDTTGFLIIAGVGGLLYAVEQLFDEGGQG
jgi:hypothetical protein